MTALVPFERATAEAALVQWAALVTGADAAVCVWENAPRPVHAGVLVVLSEVSLERVSQDGETWEYAANADPLLEMTPAVEGQRVWVVQVAVETTDQRAGYSARHIATQAATRAQWSRARALLTAAGLAFAGCGPARPADYRGTNGRMVARQLFELRMNTVAREVDTSGRTAWIQHVSATATVTSPADAAVSDSLQPEGTL